MASSASNADFSGWLLVIGVAVFAPLEVVFVALRFYARRLSKARFDLGDGLIVAALCAHLAAAGLSLGTLIQGGAGYHTAYLQETAPEKIIIFNQYETAIAMWYSVTVSLSKLAVCKLYVDLFPQRRVFILVCTIATMMVITSIVLIVVLFLACRPFSANWDPTEPGAHCLNKQDLFIWSTLPNMVTDVALLVLPLPIVWKLHSSRNMKIVLSITFFVGSLGLVATILRCGFYSNTSAFVDGTFHGPLILFWAVAEPAIYLISASMLMFRPLIERLNIKIPEFVEHCNQAIRAKRAGSNATASSAFVPFGADEKGLQPISSGSRSESDQHRGSDGQVSINASPKRITAVTHIEQSWSNV